VSSSLSLSSYPLCFALAQLPDHLVWFKSPQNDVIVEHLKLTAACVTPAMPFSFTWT
jgi:hypothetical protein